MVLRLEKQNDTVKKHTRGCSLETNAFGIIQGEMKVFLHQPDLPLGS